MWDSFLAAKVGAWMVAIEEEGMDETGYIPEEYRIWGEAMEVNFRKREVAVKVRTWENLEKGVWRYRREVLSW